MQQQRQQENSTKKVSHIRSVSSTAARYRHFGALLAQWRKNADVTQPYVVERFREYCTSKGLARLRLVQPASQADVKPLSVGQYGKLERQERRAPKFDELLPLYVTLTVGCGAEPAEGDRDAYIELARAAIEPKIHHCETVTAEQWDTLADQLAKADGLDPATLKKRQWHEIYSSASRPEGTKEETASQERDLSPEILRILRKDTSRILERGAWVEQMLSLRQEGKRLVTIQAISGAGKTRALYVLLKRLVTLPDCLPIFYAFRIGEGKMPDDYLDTFLATLRTDLGLSSPEEKVSREACIEQVTLEMQYLSNQGKQVAILLDDVQIVLDPVTGEFSDAWQSFLDAFVSDEHHAILYLATREWPHWHTRDRSFLMETELAKLSPEAGVMIWQRLGFSDVPTDLLYQASKKCDGNPHLIELGANALDRPGHVYLWPRSGRARNQQAADSKHGERMRTWLDDDTVFAKTDIAARKELTQVLSQRISHHASQLLDLLAISPIPLPFELIEQAGGHPEIAFDALARCSLISHEAAEEGRVALVPLAREAQVHELPEKRKDELESLLMTLYEHWLYDLQQYQDDAEQAMLIAELVVLYIKKHQWLKAAELIIPYGWLCVQLGHMRRIERYALARFSSPLAGQEEEVHRTFLQHRVRMQIGQAIDPDERYRVYQEIYAQATTGKIVLQPVTEIHVAHEIWHVKIRDLGFEEGLDLLEDTLHRMQSRSHVAAEIRAALNQSKARLLARWAEAEEKKGNAERALELKLDGVRIIKETIEMWETYLATSSSPLRKRSIELKLGRAYNDCAYRQRLLGNFNEAYDAIQKCLEFKQEKKAAHPGSLAVAHGEHAQILADRGALLHADKESTQALGILNDLLQKGDNSIRTDIGMLLVERGDILMQQARTTEARPLYVEGVKLIAGKASRQRFTDRAHQQIQLIDATPQYRLDAQWAEQYSLLLAYDDTDWVFPAGPFSKEEQREWDILFPHRQEDITKKRMGALISEAKERELRQSFHERREPRFHYPAIPIDEVMQRIAALEHLLMNVSKQEKHAIVRKLYERAIQEHLTQLRLYQAISEGDSSSAWECNQQLYGIPTVAEMTIALRPLTGMLFQAQSHPKAGSLATGLLNQMRTWNVDFEDHYQENQEQEQDNEFDDVLVTPETAQRFFEDMLALYGFHNWRVQISSIRTIAHVAAHLRLFVLPRRKYSIRKLRDMLRHEVETHIYRAETGFQSCLTLLGTGTAGYKRTEEALAVYVEGQGLYSKMWLGTLAVGLMAGVINAPLSFSHLVTFLEQALLTRYLYRQTFKTDAAAEKAAKEEALRRALRTVRGVPDLTQIGCSLLDRVYLQGYLDFLAFLEQGKDIQHLLVGKIGIDDLADMEQIHLRKPAIQQQHLAENLDIYAHIRKIEEHNLADYQVDSI